MYQNNPNFAFTGSQINGLPTTLDNINPAYYQQIFDFVSKNGGRLASINGLVLYDTYRFDAGVMPLKTLQFFQNGVGTQQGLVVAGTNYTKQEIDVHPWINGGRLDKGYEALIWSIQCRIQLVSSLDESVQSSGNAINLTNAVGTIADEASATDPTKAGNLMRAITEGMYASFYVNNTQFESGPLYRFPCVYQTGNYAALANAGVGATPARDAIADGMIGNGMGTWCYQMPVMRHIPELTRFGINLTIQNAFTTANNLPFRVQFLLEGIGVQPVTG